MEGVTPNGKLLPRLLIAGALTGTIDVLLVIIINYKIPAAVLFKFIASGFFGPSAFGGGADMVFYGLLFHYTIALCWATFFLLLYPKLISVIKVKSILVFATGFAIWIVMNLIVIPLSDAPPQHFKVLGVIEDLVALIVAYGVPFTLIADRFYHPQRKSTQQKMLLPT